MLADARHPGDCGLDAPDPQCPVQLAQADAALPGQYPAGPEAGSQSPSRNPGGPGGIRPSPRRVASARESAIVNLPGRQAASTALLIAGPKR